MAATAATVLVLSVALHVTAEPTALLASAFERGSCELQRLEEESTERMNATLGGGQVVVPYRATIGAAEFARLRRVARRLAGLAVTVPSDPASAAAVEATRETYRLNCRRVDHHAEEALILFALSIDDAR